MSHTCPSFPLELEREIFEIAATHHPETRPTLLLVAHRVLQWYGIILLARNLIVYILHPGSSLFCTVLLLWAEPLLFWVESLPGGWILPIFFIYNPPNGNMSRTYWHGIPIAISYPFFHFVAMSKGSDCTVQIH
jgi:hypothetical protein